MVPTKFKRQGTVNVVLYGNLREHCSIVLNEFGDTVGGDLSQLVWRPVFRESQFRNFNMTFPNALRVDFLGSNFLGDVTLDLPKAGSIYRALQGCRAKNVTINAPVATNADDFACWGNFDSITLNMPNCERLSEAIWDSRCPVFRGVVTKCKYVIDFTFNDNRMEEFDCDLPSLDVGNNFIRNSYLTSANIDRIFTSLPTYTDGSSHNIDIKNTPDFVNAHPEIARAKGWSVNGIR
ncbi:MAG: hypothetical protein RR382_00405 [Tannerellaceae bacterium]